MSSSKRVTIYDKDGDHLMRDLPVEAERLILLPDAAPAKTPDRTQRLRIMWGQHLLDDLAAGRYRSVLCAVNAQDNSSGLISQLAACLPTSQWDEKSITAHARSFNAGSARVKVLKYDMDTVEVLAVLRSPEQTELTLADLSSGLRVAADMIRTRQSRLPTASVSFLEAHANVLVDANGKPPSFETVLRTMHEAGYSGDVYPSPSMWHAAPTGVFARYPFSKSLDDRRSGGF